jgi:hypothetical protein
MILSVLRAALILALLAATPLSSAAEPSPDDVRALGAWSLEVSQHTSMAVELMGDANTLIDLVHSYESGTITVAEARSEMADWRTRVEANLNGYSARAEQLAEGPGFESPEFSPMVRSMAAAPLNALSAVRAYVAQMESFATASFNGENPDLTLIDIARFAVLQAYYEGLATANEATRASIESGHPQHHLLAMTVTNARSVTLLFELGRLNLGAAPGEHGEEQIVALLAANNAAVQTRADRARTTLRQMMSTIDSASPEQLGLTPAQMTALRAMLSTYPASIEAEETMAELLSRAQDYVDVAGEGVLWPAYIDQVTAVELTRDDLQMQRQRLAASF